MLHAGVCLARQYCTHARIVRGKESHDFFGTLVAYGFARASRTAHRGAFLDGRPDVFLYLVTGENPLEF